jgi:hypothetical protein
MIASRLKQMAPSKFQSESEQGDIGLRGSPGTRLSLMMEPLRDRIARGDIDILFADSLVELPARPDAWE